MTKSPELSGRIFSRRNLLVGLGLVGASTVFPSLVKASGAVKNYNNIDDLQRAIDVANEGDLITLAPGTYSDAQIVVKRNGLTISAQSAGKVILNGSSQITVKGNNTTFSGFQFIEGDTKGIVIKVSGSYNKLLDLNFSGYSAEKYINIEAGSQYNEVSFCNFENKPTSAPVGNLVGVLPDENVPGFHRISFCSFKNLPGPGGDYGNEPIRIGVGEKSEFISRTVIEYCYWENTGLGDSENISVKCRQNVIRYCTFKNNKEGMLVFRNGNDNMAYGNSFIDAGGIRVKEASNIFCFNNYFENSGIGGRAGSVNYDYVAGNLQNVNFLFNSFFNCAPISIGGVGVARNSWSNNIFSNMTGAIFQEVNQGTKWLGNIYQGSTGLTPISGLKSGVAKFTKKLNDFYRPALTSKTRAAAISGFIPPKMYEGLTPINPLDRDILKTLRSKKVTSWDVGAMQYSKVPAKTTLLSSKTTGPRYF